MSSLEKRKSEILEDADSDNDISLECLASHTHSEPENSSDPEVASTGIKRSLSQRFFTWTLHDLFDFNPAYIKTLRGILNVFHVMFSMFVVAMTGSACRASEATYSGFYCSTADTFTFVIACSSLIQSMIFLICCLLSKKAERRIHVTSYEVVYYVTYSVFFLISGLAITTTSSYFKTIEGQYQMNLGAAIFAFCATAAYSGSAVWFLTYHKIYAKELDDEETINRNDEPTN